MSNRRRLRPLVVERPAPATRGYQRAMQDDESFFLANPAVTYRRRAYVPGETEALLPPGTVVEVRRVGYLRTRTFHPPSVEGN